MMKVWTPVPDDEYGNVQVEGCNLSITSRDPWSDLPDDLRLCRAITQPDAATGTGVPTITMTPERVEALTSILGGYEMECAGTDEQLARIAIVRAMLDELGGEA